MTPHFEERGDVRKAVHSKMLYPLADTKTREATGVDDLVSLTIQTCGREAETYCLMTLVFITS